MHNLFRSGAVFFIIAAVSFLVVAVKYLMTDNGAVGRPGPLAANGVAMLVIGIAVRKKNANKQMAG